MAEAPESVPKNKSINVESSSDTKPVQDGFLTDLGRHLAYSAIQKPVTGVSQLVDSIAGTHLTHATELIAAPQDAQFGSVRWHLEEVASGVGAALPYLAAMALTRPVLRGVTNNSLVSMSGETAFKSASTYRTAEAATAGFVNGALFEPSDNDAGILASRFKQGTVSGITMGAMHSLSNGLNEKTRDLPFASSIVARSLTTATAGFGAGMIGAASDAAINLRPVEVADLYKSAYSTAFTGATLGLLSDSYLKLHQPKSTFPGVGKFVAHGSSSGTLFDTGMHEILRDNFSGRAKNFAEDLIERVKQSRASANTEKSGEEAAGLPEESKSQHTTDGVSVLSKLSPVERAEFIASMEHQADSKLLSEPELNKLIDKLAGSVDNWSKDNIQHYEDRLAEAGKLLREKSDEFHRVQDEAADRPQVVRTREDGSIGFSIYDHEDVQVAQAQTNEALRLRDLRSAELNAVRHRRTEDISHTINEFLADHNLPPVEIGISNLYGARASYGRGRLELNASLLKSSEFTATQFGLIIHELTHLEQDVLRVRALADVMKIDKITGETVDALHAKAEQFGIGGSQESDSELRTPKSFIENILRLRNNERLSLSDTLKAFCIMQATVEYAAPPYLEKNQQLHSQYSHNGNIVEGRNYYYVDQLLTDVISNPDQVRKDFGLPRIPKELQQLAQHHTETQAKKPKWYESTIDIDTLPRELQSEFEPDMQSEDYPEIFARWHLAHLSELAEAPEAEPANAHEEDYVVNEVAKMLGKNFRRIENKLSDYARKDHRWYYDNELERQAQPAGTLAYLLAESRGLHAGE